MSLLSGLDAPVFHVTGKLRVILIMGIQVVQTGSKVQHDLELKPSHVSAAYDTLRPQNDAHKLCGIL